MTDDWMKQAACKGATPLFFGIEGENNSSRIARELRAKAICKKCPVTSDCLQFALSNDERGIWGGTTENYRNVTMRRRYAHAYRAKPAQQTDDANWRVIESRDNFAGLPISLQIAEGADTWHGFRWGVFRSGELVFLADSEADAWLYFHSTVMA
jgi:WhiB family redox-sensing transcriptional regulator